MDTYGVVSIKRMTMPDGTRVCMDRSRPTEGCPMLTIDRKGAVWERTYIWCAMLGEDRELDEVGGTYVPCHHDCPVWEPTSSELPAASVGYHASELYETHRRLNRMVAELERVTRAISDEADTIAYESQTIMSSVEDTEAAHV